MKYPTRLCLIVMSLVQVGFANPIPDLYFEHNAVFHPGIANQINTIEIVQCLTEPEVENRTIHYSSGKDAQCSTLTWKMRVISGEHSREGKDFTCHTRIQFSRSKQPAAFEMNHRYLLFGIRSNQTSQLPFDVLPASVLRRKVAPPMLIGSKSEDIFPLALIPTKLENLSHSTTSQAKTLEALVSNLTNDATDEIIRKTTNLLAMFSTDVPPFDTIDDSPTFDWLALNLVPRIRKLPASTPLRQLRLNGLALRWNDSQLIPSYALSIPSLLKSLGVNSRDLSKRMPQLRPDQFDDLDFLGRVDLWKGLSAKQILELSGANPILLAYFVCGNVPKMDTQEQKMLFSLAGNASLDTRSRVYNLLSVWNGEPGLTSTVFLPPGSTNGSQEIIDKESTIVAFWNKKFNIGAKP